METQIVLAAVIKDGDRFLVCQRPSHKRHGGLWEFPGGKLEPGENHNACATRELKEELSLKVVSTGNVIFQARDPGSPFIIDFVAVETKGTIQLNEHSAFRWLALNELNALSLAPSDKAFVDHLIQLQSKNASA